MRAGASGGGEAGGTPKAAPAVSAAAQAALERARKYKAQQAEARVEVGEGGAQGVGAVARAGEGGEDGEGREDGGGAGARAREAREREARKERRMEVIRQGEVLDPNFATGSSRPDAIELADARGERLKDVVGTAGLGFSGGTEGAGAEEAGKEKGFEELLREGAEERARKAKEVEDAEAAGMAAGKRHKPAVSTWGVFERPSNISEAYGGGRNLKPITQEQLDRDNDALRAKLDAFNAGRGAELALEAAHEEEIASALLMGERLMDRYDFEGAIKVLEEGAQWTSVKSQKGCQLYLQLAVAYEAQGRGKDARQLYVNLRAEAPDVSVRQRCKHLMFGFSAQDKMRVRERTAEEWDVYRRQYSRSWTGMEGMGGLYNDTFIASPEEQTSNEEAEAMGRRLLVGSLAFFTALGAGIVSRGRQLREARRAREAPPSDGARP